MVRAFLLPRLGVQFSGPHVTRGHVVSSRPHSPAPIMAIFGTQTSRPVHWLQPGTDFTNWEDDKVTASFERLLRALRPREA